MSEKKEDVKDTREVPVQTGTEKQTEIKPIKTVKKNVLTKEVEKLRTELDEKNDRFIRLVADFDNYKKRAVRERTEIVETANRMLILKILPVLDNLERALDHRESSNSDSFYEGINMILSHFREILKAEGVEPIEAVGEAFDPELHDALMQVDEGDGDTGTVVSEFDKGYTLKGKVIRHSKVSVKK